MHYSHNSLRYTLVLAVKGAMLSDVHFTLDGRLWPVKLFYDSRCRVACIDIAQGADGDQEINPQCLLEGTVGLAKQAKRSGDLPSQGRVVRVHGSGRSCRDHP